MSAPKRFNSLTGDDGHPEPQVQMVFAFRDPGPDARKSSIDLAHDRPLPPVDGGVKAWSAIGGGFLALFVQFGLGNSYGAFQQYYAEHQLRRYSAQAISWIGSVQLFLTFFLATIVGQIFDTYGPRVLLVAGTVLIGTSLILTSVFTEYYQLMITHGVIFGIGSAMLYTPSVSGKSVDLIVAGQWFVKKRAAASGVVASGASLGGVVFPIMFSQLVGKLGFRSTLQMMAFVCLMLLFVATFILRARKPRTVGRPDFFEPVRAAWENAAYRWLLVGVFFGFWGLWSPFFFIGDFAIYRGFPTDLSFYMLSIMNASSMLGRLVLFTADQVGRFNILIVSLTCCGLLEMVMWPSVSSRGGVFAFTILFGFFTGGVIGCFPACVAQVSPPERIGSRLGFVLFVMSFSTLTGPPLSGILLDHSIPSNMYFSNGFFCGGVMLIGALFILLAKLSIDRRLFKVV